MTSEAKPYGELVATLRSREHRQPINPDAIYRTRDVVLFEEAADAIEALSVPPRMSMTSEVEAAKMREALQDIAAFDDVRAGERLAQSGSYSLFDEPTSVRIAREALAETEDTP